MCTLINVLVLAVLMCTLINMLVFTVSYVHPNQHTFQDQSIMSYHVCLQNIICIKLTRNFDNNNYTSFY